MQSRRMQSVRTLAGLMSTLAISSTALADAAHYWCVPGLALTPGFSSDSNTNAVVAYVCDPGALPSCCAATGRWSTTCIQKGIEYARQHQLGDICGRDAWTQGPLPGTTQFYPRDFSLVSLGDPNNPTVSGNATSFYDAEGPIAAKKLVKSGSYNLNWGMRGKTALVAGEIIDLTHGTVHGDAYYGVSSNLDGSILGQPIDFVETAKKLRAMSTAIGQYPSYGLYTKPNSNQIFLFGKNPDLNVFTVTPDLLRNVFSYTIDVPQGSAVIVNVTGTQPIIRSVGIERRNGLSAERILWNFPEATKLEISYTYLPGSVLAPKAEALLQWGQIAGTTVVKNASPVYAELHWAPFQWPGTCGCYPLDKTWSCSRDTCLDDNGRVAKLAPEAGFMEIPGGTYRSGNSDGTFQDRTSPTHRIWYSFFPAAQQPESKPLALFFNGGPGTSTSALLFSFNTAPKTLDPARTGSGQVVTNPDSWTSFANLLYIDAPVTGFSYPLPYNNNTPSVGMDMDRDASAVLRVLVRFLARHAQLQKNPVIIVGESYGGTRATIMLQHLLNYDVLNQTGNHYYDTDLRSELVEHYKAVFPDQTSWPPEMISTQFGHQVLIQPVVAGGKQYFLSIPSGYDSICVSNYEDLQCDIAKPWMDNTLTDVAARLVTPTTLSAVLGVDVRTIEWMKSTSRAEAWGRNDGKHIPDDGAMKAIFGELNKAKGDNYFVESNHAVNKGYDPSIRGWTDDSIGLTFLQNVAHVNTLITNARYDIRVYTPSVQKAFEDDYFLPMLESSSLDSTPTQGYERPGWIKLLYQPGKATPRERSIRFPPYASTDHRAGHTVTMYGYRELLADVMQWYQLPRTSYSVVGGTSSSRELYPVSDPYPRPLPILDR